jgi:reactive intermediate/imine deaminase
VVAISRPVLIKSEVRFWNFRIFQIWSALILVIKSLRNWRCDLSSSDLKKAYDPSGSPPTNGKFAQVVATNTNNLIFVAGQVSMDVSGKIVGKGDFKTQAEQALRNLKICLEAEGATFDDIVKLNTYLIDVGNLKDYQEIRSKFFKGSLPAATLIAVPALAHPDYMIEIEAIAIKPPGKN